MTIIDLIDQEFLYKLVAGVGVVCFGLTIIGFIIYGALTKGPLLRAPQTLSWLVTGMLSCSIIAFVGKHLIWIVIPCIVVLLAWGAYSIYQYYKKSRESSP